MSWRTQAACIGADPDMFFFSEGDTTGKLAAARTYCNSCPVQTECLTYACNLKIPYGIYGGTTYQQRRQLWQASP